MQAAWATIPRAPPRVLSAADFAQQTSGEEIWTASRDGDIAGFISIWRADAFIHHLFVAPAHQGQGAGGALMAFALCSLGGRAALKVSDFNVAARHFYDRLGGRATLVGTDTFGPWTRLEFGPGPRV